MIQVNDPGYPAEGVAAGTTLFGYDQRGLLNSQSNANGTSSNFSYDGNRRPTQIQHSLPGGGNLTLDR